MSVENQPEGGEPVDPARRYKGTPSRARLLEVARFFTKLGFVGFGGPLVHIAMMEDELVGTVVDGEADDGEGEIEGGWTDEATFMDGLAICNMLPGPASTHLGIFLSVAPSVNSSAGIEKVAMTPIVFTRSAVLRDRSVPL